MSIKLKNPAGLSLKERASPGAAAGGAGVDGAEAAGGALRAPPWDGVDTGACVSMRVYGCVWVYVLEEG